MFGLNHKVSEEEIKENNLEGEVEAGEEVIAPDEAGVRTTGYRECTCGALVPLPMEGEEPTVCECGVKHIW